MRASTMLAGMLSAVAIGAGASAATAQTTAPAPPATPPVVTPPAPPAPPAPVRPRLPAGVIAPGVSIEGVDVSGLTRVPATRKVLRTLVAPKMRPLVVTFRSRRIPIDPRTAGFSVNVAYAVKAALGLGRTRPIREAVDIPLRETVNSGRVRSIVAGLASRLDIGAVDAKLSFSGGRPRVQEPRVGTSIVQNRARRAISTALLAPRRPRTVELPTVRVRPAVTSVGRSVVINRAAFTLTLYDGERVVRRFGVAVGQPAYPTPSGLFSLIMKQRNPTWFPPSSPWAAGLGPVPPGPGNPLGTRWMGTSAPAIGIHGTPAPYSIGTRASHGCIRMRIPEAEYLYDQIEIGTPILII